MNPFIGNYPVSPGGGFTDSHPALDFPLPIGTPLVALKDGFITDMPGVPTRKLMGNLNNTQHWPKAKAGGQNSGNVITIDHGGGEYTSYLHDSPYDVNAIRGRRVKRGDIIGWSGHNGWSTGAHLHFEHWVNGKRIDPSGIINSGEDMVKPTYDDVLNLYRSYLGRDPTESDQNYFVSRDIRELYQVLLFGQRPSYDETHAIFKDFTGEEISEKQMNDYAKQPRGVIYRDMAVWLKDRQQGSQKIDRSVVLDYISKNLK